MLLVSPDLHLDARLARIGQHRRRRVQPRRLVWFGRHWLRGRLVDPDHRHGERAGGESPRADGVGICQQPRGRLCVCRPVRFCNSDLLVSGLFLSARIPPVQLV